MPPPTYEPVKCPCDEAVRRRSNNLRRTNAGRPAIRETFPPSEDGEVMCAECWDVLYWVPKP